jgi:hypothetical protein
MGLCKYVTLQYLLVNKRGIEATENAFLSLAAMPHTLQTKQ